MSSPTPDLKENYLRPNAQRDLEDEIAQSKAQLHVTDMTGRIESQGALRKRIRRLEHDLEMQKVPDLPGRDMDALLAEQSQIEAEIREHMPTRDMMMRNPPGAVGKNIEFEKKYAAKIRAWKRNQLLLHRGSDDPDIANAERLRPENRDSLMNMEAAQIAPKAISVPSPQFMENYKQIQFDLAVMKEKLQTLEKKTKRPRDITKPDLSPEQIEARNAALAKGRATRKANIAARKAEEAASGES